ncbi:MAG: thioredoxin family protein [Ignavibacteriaceae bacterium]|nr:thioredoxin family protein [Ignavibacteriaceae bacterium]
MKTTLFIIVFFLSSFVFAQTNYEIQTDEKTGKEIIVGTYTRDILLLSEWEEEYSTYSVDAIAADEIIPLIENIKIKIIGASWCSDSREQIPRFYKILDYMDFPEVGVELIFVNRNKAGLADEVTGLGIELVPTFIFYKNDSELGRIIETPYESLELDLLNILNETTE